MAFQPAVREHIQLSGYRYAVGEHPHAPGIPYGQEGRQGTVYMLHAVERPEKKAMKAFRSKFVDPSLVQQTRQLAQFARIAGLAACERMIVTPQNSQETLRTYPDLLYAVVMSWIEGPTWTDVLLDKRRLSVKHSHQAAYALAQTLAEMEQQGLAHCDLSAPNVMLPLLDRDNRTALKPSDYVQLIDLEQMFAPQLERPAYTPGGSPGYAPTLHAKSLGWHALSDRFAGAVLLMEMLGSAAPGFAGMAWGESYFAPEELQTDCQRYRVLMAEVRAIWGTAVADLFARAWDSGELESCPTFGEWLLELAKLERLAAQPEVNSETAASAEPLHDGAADSSSAADMLAQARKLETQRRYEEALALYRTVRSGHAHDSLAKEIDIAISQLEQEWSARQSKLEQRGKRNKRLARRLALFGSIALILLVLGGAGYTFLIKNDMLSAALAKRDVYEAEIEALQQAITDKDRQIGELAKQLAERSLPVSEQGELLMGRLAEHYAQIRELSAAGSTTGSATVPLDVFHESEQYMEKLYMFMEAGMGLDAYTLEQSRIVAAYYYTFLYNHNRNEQLNIRYFEEYRDKFAGGNE